jgi:hypothetical protein
MHSEQLAMHSWTSIRAERHPAAMDKQGDISGAAKLKT